MTTSRSDGDEGRIEALERLDRLRQSGALSDSEFEAEKARLLGGETVYVERSRPLWPMLLAAAVVLIAAILSYSFFFSAQEVPTGDAPRKDVAAAPAEPAPTGLRALSEAEQLAKAGTAAFGKASGASISVDTGDDYGDGGSFDETVAYRPGTLVWTQAGPVLLSEGEVVDAAHVSAGKIAAHYLREAGNTVSVAKAYPKAVVTGSFGKVGEWNASDRFLQTPVIYAEGGGTWQGYSCSWGSLTELAPGGPREIARFPISFSNEGAMGDAGHTIEGKIANIVKDRSFDLIYSGARSFTEHYVFANGRFTLQGGGESQMEGC